MDSPTSTLLLEFLTDADNDGDFVKVVSTCIAAMIKDMADEHAVDPRWMDLCFAVGILIGKSVELSGSDFRL